MKLLKKILNFFFSSAIGGVCFFGFVAGMLFLIAMEYLARYGTPEGNYIEDLEPLAVLIIGCASVIIAFSNCWEKLGHSITGRFIYGRSTKRNRSDMPYIKNVILSNKKNKVEIIDKILLSSKKLGHITLADFSKDPLSLKNYETKIIPLEPVTAWVDGINKKDIAETISFNFPSEDESIIKTMETGIHPTLYISYRHQNIAKTTIPKAIAVTQSGLVPIEGYKETSDINAIFPIRNKDMFSDKDQEEAIYGTSVIQITELTLGQSASGKIPENKKIKVIVRNYPGRYSFENYIKNKNTIFDKFSGLMKAFSTSETEKFEKKWEEYYKKWKEFYTSRKEELKKEKEEYKKFIAEMKEFKENKEIKFSFPQTLEDHFHDRAAHLLHKRDLPKISSEITSKIAFLYDVKEFAEYPIVKKRHALFVTAFYRIVPEYLCFEEIEESTFSKIWHWLFHEEI